MAIGLKEWVADGREDWSSGLQPLPFCTIIGVTTSAILIPSFQFEQLNSPANTNTLTVGERRKSTLSWPQKIIAYQIGFTLESLIAALEKFVG